VADKLPSTPSRLQPVGLGGRLALAAAGSAKDPAADRGRRRCRGFLSARIGHDVRAAASKRVPPAAAEDAVALGLAAASARS